MTAPFDTVLQELRDALEGDVAEAAEAVLFLQDPAACRMAASWKRLPRVVVADGAPPDGDDDRWAWLWDQVRFDVEEWARLAAVPLPEARAMAHVLAANRVVYPDGTMNRFARRWLSERVAGMVQKERRKR